MEPSGDIRTMGEALLTDARAEAARLVSAAERDAAALAEDAEQEAARVVAKAVEQAEAAARLEARRRLAAAQLEAMRVKAQAREAVLTDCLRRLAENLDRVPARADYPDRLTALAKEAAAALRQREITIQVRDADRRVTDAAWVTRVEAAVQATVRVGPEPVAIHGGLVASAREGRLRYDQSFQALLARHREALRAVLARSLWRAETEQSAGAPAT